MSKRKKKIVIPQDGAMVEFWAETLADAVAMLKPLVLKRATRKDLQSFHFHASKDGVVTISASDMRVQVQLKVEALKVTGTGTVMIDSHALIAMLGSYREPRVTIHLDEATSEARCEGHGLQFKLPAYDPAKELKAPVPGCLANSGWFFRADQLAEAIRLVRPFVDEQTTRYALGGLLLDMPEIAGGLAKIVTTDGRRATKVELPVRAVNVPARRWKPAGKEEGSTLGLPVLPVKAAIMAERMARLEGTREVGIAIIPGEPLDLEKRSFKPGHVQFVTRAAVITAVVEEGRFPITAQAYPDGEVVCEARLDKASRLDAVLAMAAASVNSESKGVEVAMSGGCIMLWSESNTRGKAQVSLVNVDMTGKGTFEADALFLKQFIHVLGDRPVTIEFRASDQPIVLRSGLDWEGVIMPLTRDKPGPAFEAKPVETVVEAEPDDEGSSHVNGEEPEDPGPEGWSEVEADEPDPSPPVPVAVADEAPKVNGKAKAAKKQK
jgi:DNA polymerase III sliding clamp (beta) subunit (PCNA family)